MTDDPLFYLKKSTAKLLAAVTQFQADLNTQLFFDIRDTDSALDNVMAAFNEVEKSLINLQDRNE